MLPSEAEMPPCAATVWERVGAQEINFVPLLFAGLMIGSICFSGGYIVGREQSNFSKIEARK